MHHDMNIEWQHDWNQVTASDYIWKARVICSKQDVFKCRWLLTVGCHWDPVVSDRPRDLHFAGGCIGWIGPLWASRGWGLFKFHRSTMPVTSLVNLSRCACCVTALNDFYPCQRPILTRRPEAWQACLRLQTRCTTSSGICIWSQIQHILDSPSSGWFFLFLLPSNRSEPSAVFRFKSILITLCWA